MKINFTKGHLTRLKELITDMLFKNQYITTDLGQHLDASQLLHCTTINSLTKIRLNLTKKIEQLENADEWVKTDQEQKILVEMQTKKELVNLVIGYKRYMDELTTNRREKEILEAEIQKLKDEQKTPADRIKEMEDKLKNITTTEF